MENGDPGRRDQHPIAVKSGGSEQRHHRYSTHREASWALTSVRMLFRRYLLACPLE